jgi:DNA-binding CsgD family transcriptional regulator
MTTSQLRRSADLWAGGCSTLEIARKLGLEEFTIYNNLAAIKRVSKVRA